MRCINLERYKSAGRIAHMAIVASLALCLAACSFAPQYQRPEQDLPDEWRKLEVGKAPLNVDWWTRFNDPALTALIEAAERNNQDLAESMAKIDSAAAQVGTSTSALFPNLNGNAGANANWDSSRTANAVDKNMRDYGYTTYNAGLTAAWELDFWGKLRNQRTYLSDVLMNTVLGHEALRLSIAAQTAKSYFLLLSLDMQLRTAKRTFKVRQKAFGIYTSRYKQGDITELDWQRAKAELETAKAQIHSSTLEIDRTEASLAVLVGRSPREIITEAMPRARDIRKLPAPPVLPEGLPSELLNRRPDLRAAEFLIMANNANIGVAKAQFFPSISLTGAFGTASAAFGHLFTYPAGMWSYGVTGSVPILDFGRNWYNLKDAEARKQMAIAVYRKAVQNAFSDLRTALSAQRESDSIVKSMKAQVASLSRAAEIAKLQYDNGYTDYLTVLDAERNLFTAELQYATALSNRLNAVVSVCQALGGGWQDAGTRPDFPIVDKEKLLRDETSRPEAGMPDKK